jgi:hypothetical protein
MSAIPPEHSCTNACKHFRDHGPKYPNSGECAVSTDPEYRAVFHSNRAATFSCRKPHLRDVSEQEVLF